MFASEETRGGIPQEVAEAVEATGYEPLLDDPARPGAGNIATNLVRDIIKSQIVLVDLTGFDAYVIHALGIAMALREHVVLLFQGDNNDLPASLRGDYCLSYRDNAAGLRELRRTLKEALQRARSDQYDSSGNTIYSALPEAIQAVLRDPDGVTTSAPESDWAARQKDIQDNFNEQFQQFRDSMMDELNTLKESIKQPAGIDVTLLNAKIQDLHERLEKMTWQLNQMTRQRDTAEDIMRLLEQERDKMLWQITQVAAILETQRTIVTHRQDDAALVFVPAGLIVPGAPRLTAEERQRDQRFVRSFYIDQTPVTNAQFARFVQATGYETVAERLSREYGNSAPTWRTPAGPDSTLAGRDNHPVVWVYRKDAMAYAKWAGRRLPTRLEWERAMRGLDGQTWPWGNAWQDKRCNLNSTGTTPVDAYPSGASPLGCLDMIGNVWEWLADERAGGKFILMGGSYKEPRLGVGYKMLVVPGDGSNEHTGFRCAMDVPAWNA